MQEHFFKSVESVIVRAQLAPLRLRLDSPLRTLSQTVAVREVFVLRLFDRDGASGAGEAAPAYWLGGADTLSQTRDGLQAIAARIAARPIAPAELRRWAGVSTGPKRSSAAGAEGLRLAPAARSALDCALLDLSAQRRGLSVAALLAGSAADAPASARPVRVSRLLSADSAPALALQTREAACKGFRTFKLKVGAAPLDQDIARARAVAGAAGADCALRLDANRAFDFEQAKALLGALAGAVAIEFVEEPLRAPSPLKLRRLRELTGVRIALDESFSDRASLTPYLDVRAADVIVLKAARLGGLSRCAQLAALAARAGIAPCATDSIEGAMGMAAAVHLAAALPYPALAAGLGGASLGSARALAPFPALSPTVEAAGPGFAVRARLG